MGKQLFKVVNGVVVRGKDYPKKITKKNALALSVAKWKFMVTQKEPLPDDGGADTCALCHAYQDDCSTCTVCPVKQKTGHGLCWGSPYIDAFDLLGAKAELAFLQSLKVKKET